MTAGFPPTASQGREVEILVEAFASVVENRSAIYISSPLTTGERAFEWHRLKGPRSADGAEDEFRRAVIEPNREDAAKFAHELRRRLGSVVIDPTAMADIPGWTQSDYRLFWGKVIERFCETIVFRDGWQYSSGCTYEFLIAYRSGTRLLAENLTPLDGSAARNLLSAAIEETSRHRVPADFLRAVLAQLEHETTTPPHDHQ